MNELVNSTKNLDINELVKVSPKQHFREVGLQVQNCMTGGNYSSPSPSLSKWVSAFFIQLHDHTLGLHETKKKHFC